MNSLHKLENSEHPAIDIIDDLKKKHRKHLKENIVSVKIIQPENIVWLEVTTENTSYDETFDRNITDQIIIRTDLGFITEKDNLFFRIEDSIQVNAKKFLEELDSFSLVMIADLFKEEYSDEINRKHHE